MAIPYEPTSAAPTGLGPSATRSPSPAWNCWNAGIGGQGIVVAVERDEVHEAHPVVQTEGGVVHAGRALLGKFGEDGLDQPLVLVGMLRMGPVANHPDVLHGRAHGYDTAFIRLLRASWVTSARPSSSSSGGRYMPNRPR